MFVYAAAAVRSLGSTTATTYAWRVGTSICESSERASRSAIATPGSGRTAIAASSTFEGRWVKTIVRSRPIRPASRTATWNESAWRMPIAKKTIASVVRRGAVLADEQVRDERLRDEAAAEAVEREERGEPQDDRRASGASGGSARLELVAALDRGREPRRRQQPARRRAASG